MTAVTIPPLGFLALGLCAAAVLLVWVGMAVRQSFLDAAEIVDEGYHGARDEQA